MRKLPTVKRVMTPFPYSISREANLADARQMMEEHEIGHLPVTDSGGLFGMLSEREVRVAELLAERQPDMAFSVGDVCERNPHEVDLSERLDHVAMTMAERQLDAAIVVKGERLAGIVTHTDMCRFLADLLRTLAGPPDGNEAA